MSQKINRPTGKFQQVTDLKELKPGDIVRGKTSHRTFIVHANYGSAVIAIDVQHISNPPEWDVLR